MRFMAVFVIAFLAQLVIPGRSEERIGYNCDPDSPIYIKSDPAILDRIVLGAFGKEYSLRKTADSPLDKFADDNHEVEFETLADISVVTNGRKISCKARS